MPEWLQRILETPPVWILVIGYVLAALVIAEILVGFRRLPVPRPLFRRIHFAIAWIVAGIMALHAGIGIAHGLLWFGTNVTIAADHVHRFVAASPDNLPIWLDLNGLAIVVFFVLQALSGLRVLKLTRPQFLGLHSAVAWLIVGFASLHVVLATLHLATG
jgi:hypothetical protein